MDHILINYAHFIGLVFIIAHFERRWGKSIIIDFNSHRYNDFIFNDFMSMRRNRIIWVSVNNTFYWTYDKKKKLFEYSNFKYIRQKYDLYMSSVARFDCGMYFMLLSLTFFLFVVKFVTRNAYFSTKIVSHKIFVAAINLQPKSVCAFNRRKYKCASDGQMCVIHF